MPGEISFEAANALLNGFTLAVVGIVGVALLLLVRELHRLRQLVNVHHGILTAIGTMDGLVKALQAGLEEGGLSAETRHAIYHAHDEQVRLAYDVVTRITGSDPPTGISLRFTRTSDFDRG